MIKKLIIGEKVKKFRLDGNNEWWTKAKKYDVNDDLNFKVHHVIPVGVLENN